MEADYYKKRFEGQKSIMAPESDPNYYEQRFKGIGEGDVTFPFSVREEEMGAPGLGITEGRFSVAGGRNIAEKINAFRKQFPDGDLALAPISQRMGKETEMRDVTKPQLLFRRTQDEPWSIVDPGITQKFEPIADIADFVGSEWGSMLGEVASLHGAGKGIKLLPLLGRLFAGATGGDIAQQGVESLRDIQTETPEEIVSGAATKGAGAVLGGALGSAVSRTFRGLTGGGLFEMQRGGPETIEAFKQLGVPPPMPQQLAISPTLKRIAAQSSAAAAPIERYVDQQEQAAVKALQGIRVRPGGDLVMEISKAEDQSRKALLANISVPKVEATTAGRKLQQAVENWDALARTKVNAAYTSARNIEQPQFDLSPVKQVAEQIERGVQGVSQSGAPVQISKTNSELLDVIETIKSLDPSLPELRIEGGKVAAPIDQLQALKQRLFDLKTPDAGVNFRQEHRVAAELYNAINDVISKPRNTNPAFVAAWRNAERTAARRFDTLEKLKIQQIAKSETPSQLAIRLNSPGNAENIALIRKLKQPDEFKSFQDFVKTDLIRKEIQKPGSISQYMSQMDPPTLNMIFTKNEQKTLNQVGTALQRLSDANIQKALRDADNQGRVVSDLFRSGNAARLSEISKMVAESGGLDSSLGRSVRAGLVEDIIKSVTTYSKGGTKVDFRALNKTIEEYQKLGLTRFLTPSDMAHLKNQRLVAEAIKEGSDVGASMAAAEASGNMVYRVSKDAMLHMARLFGVGRFLTTPMASYLLIGTGTTTNAAWRNNADLILKATGAIAGSAMMDVERLEPNNG